jgi:hypothetical protein
MTPTQAITHLADMLAKIDAIRQELAKDAAQVQEQWAALGSMGAQRDDHAAALLTKLRQPLWRLQSFASTCHDQIGAWHAEPFAHEQEQVS